MIGRLVRVVDTACTVIGRLDALLETILTCTLQSPQYVSAMHRFDLVILVRIQTAFSASALMRRLSRVVNIAIEVSLSLVSVILLWYRHVYCQYIRKPVSLAVSPIYFT